MSWEGWIKKYVWDDDRTPYFVRSDRLTRAQADYEVFAYGVFVGVLFAVVAVVSLAESAAIALYAFTVVCAALIFGATKHLYAALYCAATPLAAWAFYLAGGWGAELGSLDHVLLLGFLLMWLWYSTRIVAIAKAYPGLPEAARPPGRWRGPRLDR